MYEPGNMFRTYILPPETVKSLRRDELSWNDDKQGLKKKTRPRPDDNERNNVAFAVTLIRFILCVKTLLGCIHL